VNLACHLKTQRTSAVVLGGIIRINTAFTPTTPRVWTRDRRYLQPCLSRGKFELHKVLLTMEYFELPLLFSSLIVRSRIYLNSVILVFFEMSLRIWDTAQEIEEPAPPVVTPINGWVPDASLPCYGAWTCCNDGLFPFFLAINVAEALRASIGWVESGLSPVWTLRETYYPWDIKYHPLGLKPTDAKDCATMQSKELRSFVPSEISSLGPVPLL